MNERLSVGGTLERIFELYGQKAAVLLPGALIVFLIIDLVAAVVYRAGGGLVLALVAAVVELVGLFWYMGAVVEAVRESTEHEQPLTMGRLFQSVEDRIWPLIGVGLIAAVCITIGLVIVIIPGLVLATFWAVALPAVVVERKGIDAFGRSIELVRGNAWRVFGVLLVVVVIQEVVVQVLRFAGRGNFFAFWGLSLVGNVVTAPLVALAASVLYFELRRIAAGVTSRGTEPQDPGTAPGTPGTAPSA